MPVAMEALQRTFGNRLLRSRATRIGVALASVALLTRLATWNGLIHVYGAIPRPAWIVLLTSVVLCPVAFAALAVRRRGSLLAVFDKPFLADWVHWFALGAFLPVVVTYFQSYRNAVALQETLERGAFCLCNPPNFPLGWVLPVNPLLQPNEFTVLGELSVARVLIFLSLSIASTVSLFFLTPMGIRRWARH